MSPADDDRRSAFIEHDLNVLFSTSSIAVKPPNQITLPQIHHAPLQKNDEIVVWPAYLHSTVHPSRMPSNEYICFYRARPISDLAVELRPLFHKGFMCSIECVSPISGLLSLSDTSQITLHVSGWLQDQLSGCIQSTCHISEG